MAGCRAHVSFCLYQSLDVVPVWQILTIFQCLNSCLLSAWDFNTPALVLCIAPLNLSCQSVSNLITLVTLTAGIPHNIWTIKFFGGLSKIYVYNLLLILVIVRKWVFQFPSTRRRGVPIRAFPYVPHGHASDGGPYFTWDLMFIVKTLNRYNHLSEK